MAQHAVVQIVLVGVDGALDRAEGKYPVRYLLDQLPHIQKYLMTIDKEYENMGWSIAVGDELLSTEELELLLIELEKRRGNEKDI